MTRILALDVGERRIGVALSDPLGITARPLTVIQRGSKAEDFATIQQLATTGTATAPVTQRGPKRVVLKTGTQRMRAAVMMTVSWKPMLAISDGSARSRTVAASRIAAIGRMARPRRRAPR